MLIRRLEKKDIPKAVEIIVENYTDEYFNQANSEIKAMFSNNPIKPEYYVAEDGGEIIGLSGYIQTWMDYDIYQLFWVNVTPKRQRSGVGKLLIAKIIEDLKLKGASLIMLSADQSKSLPKYYQQKFGFKVAHPFNNNSQYLMFLNVRD